MSLLSIAMLVLLGAIWGASFIYIKIALVDLGPMAIACLRVFIGTILLWIVVAVRKMRVPRDPRVWLRFCFVGFFGILLPFALISWGGQHIDSSLSAILNASMPLFTYVGVLLMRDERLSAIRASGLLVGFAGILVLMLPQLGRGVSSSHILGELAIVGATISYALSILFARHKLSDQPPLFIAIGQVTIGLVLFIPLMLLEGVPSTMPSLNTIGAVTFLGVLGTGIAYILYYGLLDREGVTSTALVTYIIPLFGVLWGWSVLGEKLHWTAFLALALILLGMGLVNGLLRRRTSRIGASLEAEGE